MKILVTGGTGYIGSHICIQLIEAGMTPIILDNLYNSNKIVLARIKLVSNVKPIFYQGDVRDKYILKTIFAEHNIAHVIHCAGVKSVGESVLKPLKYYDNNMSGTLNLINEMDKAGIKNIIFSSSATVYGNPISLPIREDSLTSVTNPYGRSKLIIEECLSDFHKVNPEWNITILRYFNPVGAHESGLIGEDPKGIPNNLVPFIAQVAAGYRDTLNIFGNDYLTNDGTGVRDYIHVVDLALGHVAALNVLSNKKGLHIFNLGVGKGYSVLEILAKFEKVTQRVIPYQFLPRRDGDIAECWADPSYAEEILNWKAVRTLTTIVTDTWCWQQNIMRGNI